MFVLEQLLQQLGGDVLVLQAAHFGEELVAKDADVRLGQSGGGEDVDHLAFGGDGFAHELADGGVNLLGRLPVRAALFVQRGLQGLEKGNVVSDLRRLIAGGAEGKGAGKLRHHLHPTLLAVFLFEDVLQSGGDEREAFGGFARRPLVPVEAVHQVAGDAVFLQHDCDSLCRIKGRVPLPSALGVGDERLLDNRMLASVRFLPAFRSGFEGV